MTSEGMILLPCPFCGMDVTNDEGCFPCNRERTIWEVRCGNPNCFAHEPSDVSREAAIARWNRRDSMLLETLKEAKRGLEWYQAEFPEAVDGSDQEAMERIDQAIASLEHNRV